MSDSILSQTRRVLVIDDNDAIHEDFRTILGGGHCRANLADDEATLFGDAPPQTPQAPFTVDCAFQGQEGYAKVKSAVADANPYHLAFVDMRMPPGWDGVQTIKKLWEVDPHLQVVICSAYSAYSWKQIAATLGSNDRLLILKKPFDEYEVFQMANSQTAKWLLTRQASLKLSELENLVEARTMELKETALVDRLTGLCNRQLLNDRLTQLIGYSRREPDRKFAVLYLDFDRFKVINDSLGHEVGDMLIIGIANRLRHETRRTDTVASMTTAARLGGDEFIVVLDQLHDFHDAVRVAERMLKAVSEPYEIKGHVVHSTASIGITTNSINYQSAEDMIRDADIAMYRAKSAGKACYMVFDRKMQQEAINRLSLENDLRNAIGRNQFLLHYQPIVALADSKTVGFEALVRWQHPHRGMVSPADFIPLAEEIGVIVPLGAWVLNEACRQMAQWRKEYPEFANLVLSVNLSRRQLVVPGLAAEITAIMERHGLRPSDVKLEITESAIMHDPEDAIRVLHEIRRSNIELHLDDFGTGYSSLSCLHRFPIDGLKIDRAFVKNMLEQKDDALVVDTIVSLANKLNLRLVAEGVENTEQLGVLRSMGCPLVQGYYFARPLSAEKAVEFVRTAGAELRALASTAAA